VWDRDELLKRAQEMGIECFMWGRTGPGVWRPMEEALGLPFSQELREFAETVGNLDVPPCTIEVTGNRVPQGDFHCAQETFRMRREFPGLPVDAIVIMVDQDWIVCATAGSTVVREYEIWRVAPGKHINEWPSLAAYVDWLLEQMRMGRLEFDQAHPWTPEELDGGGGTGPH